MPARCERNVTLPSEYGVSIWTCRILIYGKQTMGDPPPWRLTNTHPRENSKTRNVIYSDPQSVNSDRRLVIISLSFVFRN